MAIKHDSVQKAAGFHSNSLQFKIKSFWVTLQVALTLQASGLHSSLTEGLLKESQRYSGTVSRVSVCLHTTDRVLK